ncbi:hypothetical protein HPB52_014837 [Rhipicephalus sanguineus]|uniref:Uncharacterized protein n=1 Tax=Rhipicephalus sanguineus TaxID=34632 RepID=A0A9D4PMY5_RHISA|nr:hypothetical protein HPB52_014837 [Rhipicephalus sanguineus]
MDSERWPEARFPARFHPDLTAISERPSEEFALREAYEGRSESSNEPTYWSTESGVPDQRSPPAREAIAKVKTQRSKQNVADQAFGDNDEGPNWLHHPTALRDSPQFDVDAYSEERRLLSASSELPSNLQNPSQRAFSSKDRSQHERASRAQRVVSPVYQPSKPDTCSKCALTAFLVALSLVCVVAVFVDIKRRAEEVGDQSTTVGRVDAPATAAVTESSAEKREVASASSTTTSKPSTRKLRKRYFAPSSVVPLEGRNVREHSVSVPAFSETDAVDLTRTTKRGRAEVTRTVSFATERRYTNHSRGSVTTIPTASASKSGTHALSAPIQKPTRHRCGVAFYTYCSETRHDVYYRHVTRSCVPTRTDYVQVCNRSPNRFATLEACKHSCMHSELPAESCFEKALFSGCSRQDVSASWWLFDGKHCRPWHFPGGLCPDFSKTDVFVSQHECMNRCFPLRHAPVRTHAGRRRRVPCRPPKVGTVCDVDVIKFPYFADITTGSGRVRCLKASASYLLRHRCLIGSNHFPTETICKRTCVDSAPGQRPKYILD